MNPTFRAGDLLIVFPFRDKGPRRGDVVVLRPPGEGRLIAHRIVAVGSGRVQTRGDNNDLLDPWALGPKDLIGRVVRRERRGKVRGLRGGPAGDIFGRVVRCLTMARLALFRVFRPAYRWADRAGIFKRLLPYRRWSRLVAIQRPDGVEWQLAVGRFVLGRRPPGSRQWQVRRPLKPFLDLDRLA